MAQKQVFVMFRLEGVQHYGELVSTFKTFCRVRVTEGGFPVKTAEYVIPAKECKVKTLDMRHVYVIGCGSDCDGYNSGYISKAINPAQAERHAWQSNEWSDGIRSVAVNEITAREYCNDYMKRFSNYDKI